MRYLLLVLLCIIALPSAALAADSWALVDQDVPGNMVWDQVAPATVDTNNDGTNIWDATYSLDSVMGPTLTPTAINRWGIEGTPVSGTVALAADYAFGFNVTAPPLTTLKYNLPVTPTSVAVQAGLADNWQLNGPGGFITTALAANETTIHRFTDVGDPALDWAHNWCLGEAEACAGQVPAITTGYPQADGTAKFQPTWNVTRDQMAVFMARALQLELLPYAGTFTDVNDAFWACKEIDALVGAGVVTGYPDATFRPALVVDRATMAVFVARGLAGGEDNVITPAETIEFTDENVSTPQLDGGWAYKHVQYCVANNVVTGYPDNTYRPKVAVNRGTMIVFMYRAFVRPTSSVVVLGGPAITSVDPAAATYSGWSSAATLDDPDIGHAYVVFDAVRFGANPTAFDVQFDLVDADDAVALTSGAIALDATTLKNAYDAAVASGDPYFVVTWPVDVTGLAHGFYTLETTVAGVELARTVTLGVGTVTLMNEGFESGSMPAGWVIEALNGSTTGWGVSTIASDESWQMGCDSDHAGSPLGVPDGTYALTSWPNADNTGWDGPGSNEGQVTTAAMDCSALSSVVVNWSGAVAINDGQSSTGDCQYSVDGGVTWTSIDPDQLTDGYWWCACCDGSGWISPDGYIDFSYDISAAAAGKSDVRLRWTFTGGCCWGWIVDSVKVDGLK